MCWKIPLFLTLITNKEWMNASVSELGDQSGTSCWTVTNTSFELESERMGESCTTTETPLIPQSNCLTSASTGRAKLSLVCLHWHFCSDAYFQRCFSCNSDNSLCLGSLHGTILRHPFVWKKIWICISEQQPSTLQVVMGIQPVGPDKN